MRFAFILRIKAGCSRQAPYVQMFAEIEEELGGFDIHGVSPAACILFLAGSFCGADGDRSRTIGIGGYADMQ
nr:hypothetical protein Iba_chr01cCG8640 [Ipomoea batatas]